MDNLKERTFLWRRFTLREGVLLGFCATFIVVARAALRLHLHVPGHVMFFTMFFFLIARGCVPRIGSVTLVAVITCAASMAFGMGHVGVMVLVLYLLPALVVELFGMLFPSFINLAIACALVGVTASALRAAAASSVEVMIGLEERILVTRALTSLAMNALFGGLGSLAVPSIIRTLRRNGLIDDAAAESRQRGEVVLR